MLRLNATGGPVFGTYLGGIGQDGADVVIDSSGALIVTGTTRSTDFPITAGAYDRTFNAAPADDHTACEPGHLHRAPDRRRHRSSPTARYFGGQTYEVVLDSVIDAQGFLTIAGYTTSSATGRDIPVTADAFDATWNGSEDGFIARFKLDGNGTADLKYSSFLGGVNVDTIEGIALDPTDPEVVTVAGHSWYDIFTGPFFPTTAGVFKPKLTPSPPVSQLFPHSKTGFVTKFSFPAEPQEASCGRRLRAVTGKTSERRRYRRNRRRHRCRRHPLVRPDDHARRASIARRTALGPARTIASCGSSVPTEPS